MSSHAGAAGPRATQAYPLGFPPLRRGEKYNSRSTMYRLLHGLPDPALADIAVVLTCSSLACMMFIWRYGLPVTQQRPRWNLAVAAFYVADYVLIVANRWEAIGVAAAYEGLWVCSMVRPALGMRMYESELFLSSVPGHGV